MNTKTSLVKTFFEINDIQITPIRTHKSQKIRQRVRKTLRN